MFGIGFWELVVIVLVILLVLGPDKLGPIARAVGRAMREMRKGVDEFKDTFDVDAHVRDIETLRSEFVESVMSDAEEVEVVGSREPGGDHAVEKDSAVGSGRRERTGAHDTPDGDFPEVIREEDHG
jgi:Tat protein translocase TatB subunit